MQFLNRLQQITLYMFFFSINFEMMSIVANSNFSFSKVFGIIYILSILPQIQKFVRIDFVGYYVFPLVLFFFWLTLIGLVNINEINSSFFDFSLFLNILLFWIMINHGRKDYLVLEKGMLSFALGSVAITIIFVLGLGSAYQGGRLWMFGDDPNALASRTLMGMMILVLAVTQNRLNLGRYRFLLLLPIPVMLKLLFETGSRFGFIVFVLSLGAGILMYKSKEAWKKLLIYFLGIVSMLISFFILTKSVTMIERLLSTVQSGDTSGRSDIWQLILPIVMENPIFGYGRTGYILESTIIFGKETSPHNVLLEVLCYTGIVGLIIYLVFLYRIGIASLTSYRTHHLLLPILLLIPVAGMILSIQILTLKIGWVIFAYIVSALAIKGVKEPALISNK